MKQENRTISWLSINSQLIDCLKTKTNHKYSRYDAFVWLVEKISCNNKNYNTPKAPVKSNDFTASYIRLADEWKWTRQTVQKFIEELVQLSIISIKRQGNTFAFSLNPEAGNKLVL